MSVFELALVKNALLKAKAPNHIYSTLERQGLNEEAQLVLQMVKANTNKINYNGLTYTYDINFLKQIKKKLGGIKNGN